MQLFYTVRPGDTLYQIANRWSLPVESLIAANNLQHPNTIHIGQQLSIPPGVNVVYVEPGDTVYRISERYRIPANIIIAANNLSYPYVIYPGQLLKIPQGVPYYIVQGGDSLFQIARRFNVITGNTPNYELIREVNQLESYMIYPGMRLIIPYAPIGNQGIIAYTSDRGGMFDIWLYESRTGENIQLTQGLADSFSEPLWSPDSSKIAFIGKNRILTVIDIYTQNFSQLDQVEESTSLDWSPNSREIAYVNQNQIVIYDVISHQVTRISHQGVTDIQWFPNGSELLLQASNEAGNGQFFILRSNGTEKRKIYEHMGGPIHNVRISPDGTFVSFTSPGVSISIIHTLEIATGIVYEIQGGPQAKNYYPTWSNDSMNLSYSATALDQRGYYSLIRTVGRRGDNDITRAVSTCFATPVSWSPNGGKVAYLSGCIESQYAKEIWIVDINHPVPIRVVDSINITSLQWSPTSIQLRRKMYSNPIYNVTFSYPASWRQVTPERYEGIDGFFQIGAIYAETSIDQVCHNEASHPLMPYGSKPQIHQLEVQNEEACLILPSKDQPKEMNNQAAFIISYPTPITINDTIYNYFIIYVDQVNIKEIISSFQFIR